MLIINFKNGYTGTKTKADHHKFIVEKKQHWEEKSILAHCSFLYYKKEKKRLQILIIYTNTTTFKNKSLI